MRSVCLVTVLFFVSLLAIGCFGMGVSRVAPETSNSLVWNYSFKVASEDSLKTMFGEPAYIIEDGKEKGYYYPGSFDRNIYNTCQNRIKQDPRSSPPYPQWEQCMSLAFKPGFSTRFSGGLAQVGCVPLPSIFPVPFAKIRVAPGPNPRKDAEPYTFWVDSMPASVRCFTGCVCFIRRSEILLVPFPDCTCGFCNDDLARRLY